MNLSLDAEALYQDLREGVRGLLAPATRLVGIRSGGAWLAERLQADLQRDGAAGTISSSLHRDDYRARGLVAGADPTALPFAIDDADLLLIDDVLNSGRTVRAVLNELYDYGRPARVRLAVLVDRGGRELPIEATFAAARISLPSAQKLRLARADDGTLSFDIEERR